MSAGSHDFMKRDATEEVDGDEGASACVTADELVLRDAFGVNHSCYLGLTLDFFGEPCCLHQILQILVVRGNVALERCFVVVLLKNLIYHLSVHAELVNVNDCL